mmetsp:Transcript_62779/g.104416  ORF Transcript_62779/g.104416 Transcript_62779/m.104416 type:complete len:113 (-) Transcript_62779:515-853(-)
MTVGVFFCHASSAEMRQDRSAVSACPVPWFEGLLTDRTPTPSAALLSEMWLATSPKSMGLANARLRPARGQVWTLVQSDCPVHTLCGGDPIVIVIVVQVTIGHCFTDLVTTD